MPQRVDQRCERVERPHQDRADDEDAPRTIAVAGGPDHERDEASHDQVQRGGDGDCAAAPPELRHQHRKEHTEPGVRVPHAEHDERAGAHHHPALPAGDVGHETAMIRQRRLAA